MSVVTFNVDIFPYVRGDVVDLDGEEKKRVDAQAKLRHLDSPYKAGAHDVLGAIDSAAEAAPRQALASREAARQNNLDQAAVLAAQREAVAEPANVDALGVVPQSDQVVSGNAPVDNVTVDNAQVAVDVGKDEPLQAKVNGKKVKTSI